LRTGPTSLALLLSASLWGCSVPRPWEMVQLDEIPAEKLAEIDALPEIRPEKASMVSYRKLGDVEGVSCKRSSKQLASWEDAVRRAKFRAMQKGANAIADLSCEAPQSHLLTTLCYESIRCTASAVLVEKR